MPDVNKLQEVNNKLAMLAPGGSAEIVTKDHKYKVFTGGTNYFVTGGEYGARVQRLKEVPRLEYQGNMVFYDNPVFRHYVTRTSEVLIISIDETQIYTNGR